jgi:hypothetical protein
LKQITKLDLDKKEINNNQIDLLMILMSNNYPIELETKLYSLKEGETFSLKRPIKKIKKIIKKGLEIMSENNEKNKTKNIIEYNKSRYNDVITDIKSPCVNDNCLLITNMNNYSYFNERSKSIHRFSTFHYAVDGKNINNK